MTEVIQRTTLSTRALPRITADWATVFGRILITADLLAVITTITLAASVAGLSAPWMSGSFNSQMNTEGLIVCSASAVIWLFFLAATASRSPRVVGTGATEYRRVVQATFLVFGLVALIAYVLDVPGLRLFLAFGLGMGIPLLVTVRWIARKWLVGQRKRGRMSRSVLLVGSLDTIATVASDVQRNPAAGFKVVGACTPSGVVAGTVPGTGIPVSGSLASLTQALDATGADTVIITSANEFSPAQVRELSWKLEPGQQHLVLAPSLTDIGGPRLHTRPVNGLPLIHVETPRYEGGKLYAKRLFDIVASGALILVLSPVLLGIAMVIRLSTPGTILFRQPRVGLKGSEFSMLKFRSMYEDAEDRLADLAHVGREEGNAVMFKMRDDPRVTPIGKFLRRYSLDELPQLFNVFLGSMSLVGPRPPLEREVVQYSDHVHRRFLVKPGITGLWQVSGRSDLDWDETVRLDLFYVENWTMIGDIFILWKTARAVIRGEGAY
ncbi:sugar transferase [Microbacterium sp. NPDC064584]|uniref:sugar transferase n=1 Tax=Microbacterium sp. NPDC064584 TaxID=3155817 RepID=UPI00341BE9F8